MKYDLTLNVPLVERLQTGASGHWYRIDYDLTRRFGLGNRYSRARGRVNPFSVRDESCESGFSADAGRSLCGRPVQGTSIIIPSHRRGL